MAEIVCPNHKKAGLTARLFVGFVKVNNTTRRRTNGLQKLHLQPLGR